MYKGRMANISLDQKKEWLRIGGTVRLNILNAVVFKNVDREEQEMRMNENISTQDHQGMD